MTIDQFVAIGFLTISTAALIAQTMFLVGLFAQHQISAPPRRGLVRTVACRVLAAGLYVALGVSSLLVPTKTALITSFLVYSFTQCLWGLNSAADRRISCRLNVASGAHGRHRLKEQDTIGHITVVYKAGIQGAYNGNHLRVGSDRLANTGNPRNRG